MALKFWMSYPFFYPDLSRPYSEVVAEELRRLRAYMLHVMRDRLERGEIRGIAHAPGGLPGDGGITFTGRAI